MSALVPERGVSTPERGPGEMPSEDSAYLSWEDEYIRSPTEPTSGELASRWQGLQRGSSQRSITSKLPALRQVRKDFWDRVKKGAESASQEVYAMAAHRAAQDHVSIASGLKRAIAAAIYRTDSEGSPMEGESGLPIVRPGLEASDIRQLTQALSTIQEVDFAACGVLQGPSASAHGGVASHQLDGGRSHGQTRTITLMQVVQEIRQAGPEAESGFIDAVLASDPMAADNGAADAVKKLRSMARGPK